MTTPRAPLTRPAPASSVLVRITCAPTCYAREHISDSEAAQQRRKRSRMARAQRPPVPLLISSAIALSTRDQSVGVVMKPQKTRLGGKALYAHSTPPAQGQLGSSTPSALMT
eukprot:6197414-Pleurochrysis_carterae.AAC.4